MDWEAPSVSELIVESAFRGRLYYAGGTTTASGVADAEFALFNPGNKGLSLYVFSARVGVAAAMSLSLFAVDSNPGYAAGNKPVNAMFGAGAADALIQVAAGGDPANVGVLANIQAAPGTLYEMIAPGLIVVRPGNGLVISSTAIAGEVRCAWQWAELPR